jgi:hypothetical protein
VATIDVDGSSPENSTEGNSKPDRPLVSKAVIGGDVDRKEDVSALDRLGLLLGSLSRNEPIPVQAAEWLRQGVIKALRKGEAIDVSLGLSGVGCRSLQGKVWMHQRALQLIRAVQSVAVDEVLSDWQRCVRLAPLVCRFMRSTWPQVIRLDAPLHGWPDWKVHVFYAARTDMRLPTTAAGLHLIVKANAVFPVEKKPATLLAQLIEVQADERTTHQFFWPDRG